MNVQAGDAKRLLKGATKNLLRLGLAHRGQDSELILPDPRRQRP
jgi:hypothetical protein